MHGAETPHPQCCSGLLSSFNRRSVLTQLAVQHSQYHTVQQHKHYLEHPQCCSRPPSCFNSTLTTQLAVQHPQYYCSTSTQTIFYNINTHNASVDYQAVKNKKRFNSTLAILLLYYYKNNIYTHNGAVDSRAVVK